MLYCIKCFFLNFNWNWDDFLSYLNQKLFVFSGRSIKNYAGSNDGSRDGDASGS